MRVCEQVARPHGRYWSGPVLGRRWATFRRFHVTRHNARSQALFATKIGPRSAPAMGLMGLLDELASGACRRAAARSQCVMIARANTRVTVKLTLQILVQLRSARTGSAKAEGHASDCLGVERRGRPCRRARAGSWPVLQRRAKGAHHCPWPCCRASARCSRQFSCPCFRSGRRRPRRRRPSWSFVGVAPTENRNARTVALIDVQQRRREDGGILVLP